MSHCTQSEESVKRQAVEPDWAEVLRRLRERRDRKILYPPGSVVRYKPENMLGIVLKHARDEYGDHVFQPDDPALQPFKSWGVHLEPAEREDCSRRRRMSV